MKVQETANGFAYTHEGVTIIFRHGDDLEPQMVFGDSLVTIDRAYERFGPWNTRAWRENFMRRFTSPVEYVIPRPPHEDW